MPIYHRPASVAEALTVLAAADGAARPLVGGTDLIVGLRHGTIRPEGVVDLKSVLDLPDPIAVSEDGMDVGPTLTLTELVDHPVVNQWFPGLVEAAGSVGSVAIRNRASLIGNSCNGSPAADTAPPLLALGASVTVTSAAGQRTVPISEFFLGPRRTLCGPDELVTGIHLPRPEAGSGSASRRLTRRRGVDIATVSVAAHVDAEDRVLLAMGAVGPKPLLAETSEPLSLGDGPGLVRALDRILEMATPISDVRASREYRLATIRALAKRAVVSAAERRNHQEVLP